MILVWGFPISDLTSARHKAYKHYLGQHFDEERMQGGPSARFQYIKTLSAKRQDSEDKATASQITGRSTRSPFTELGSLVLVGKKWQQAMPYLSPIVRNNHVKLEGDPGRLEPLFSAIGETCVRDDNWVARGNK